MHHMQVGPLQFLNYHFTAELRPVIITSRIILNEGFSGRKRQAYTCKSSTAGADVPRERRVVCRLVEHIGRMFVSFLM